MSQSCCLTVQEAFERINDDSDIGKADIMILPPIADTVASNIEETDEDILRSIEPGEVFGELELYIQKIVDTKSKDKSPQLESDSNNELLANYRSAKSAKKSKWVKPAPKQSNCEWGGI